LSFDATRLGKVFAPFPALFLGLWRLTEWSTSQRRVTTRTTAPASAMAAPGPAASQWAPPPGAPAPSPPVAPPEASPTPVAAAPVPETTTTVTETRAPEPPAATEWRRPEEQV